MKRLGMIIAGAIAFSPTIAVSQSENESAQGEDENMIRVIADPKGVTCQRRAVPGSRAQRIRICMTNAEWEEIRYRGNSDARRLIDMGLILGGD